MAQAVKRRPTELYSRLLVLYPSRYRQRYGQPMTQTFDDMLEAEPNTARRGLIWARALLDLPVSAAQEHLKRKEEITMSRNLKILIAAVVAGLLFANILSFWFGSLHARQTTAVQRVTTMQLADAMQADNFYSSYGGSALLFSGRIARMTTKNDAALVEFVTNRPYAVTCQFAHAPHVVVGQTITVAAPGGSADRLPHGVLLHSCLLT